MRGDGYGVGANQFGSRHRGDYRWMPDDAIISWEGETSESYYVAKLADRPSP